MKIPALLLLLFFWTASPLVAIEIQGHSATENDRFANDAASFIGTGYNWSGIGRATTGDASKGGHWATMISPNVFLSANHYHPVSGTSLYFYPDNDPSPSPIVRTIANGQRIGTSDLWIGTLDQVLPNTVSYYNHANQVLNSAAYASSILANENSLTVGITETNTGYGANRLTNMAVGRNIIDDFALSLNVSGTTAPALRTLNDLPGDSNLVTHESQLVGGDSGAPLFIDVGGNLQLVGINWAIGPVDIDPDPETEELRNASYYSYLGNYSAQIQNYVDANQPVPAPEPSTALILLAGLGLCCTRRYR